ncbi:hypothetical protein [Nocardioides salarius]
MSDDAVLRWAFEYAREWRAGAHEPATVGWSPQALAEDARRLHQV